MSTQKLLLMRVESVTQYVFIKNRPTLQNWGFGLVMFYPSMLLCYNPACFTFTGMCICCVSLCHLYCVLTVNQDLGHIFRHLRKQRFALFQEFTLGSVIKEV